MQNPLYFILSLLIIFTALALFIFHYPVIGFVLFLAGLVMLIHWNTISYSWMCKRCGLVFNITGLQNVLGFDLIRAKYLYCPQCRRRTWCKEVPKKVSN